MEKAFKKGDKVFAKIKGYPAWPACVLEENGKKYKVEFYGTGETGIVKCEDLYYYTEHKNKLTKPLKRKDYSDAVEQIEEAIKKAGGDGNSSKILEEELKSSKDPPGHKTTEQKRKRSSMESSHENSPLRKKNNTSVDLNEKPRENDSVADIGIAIDKSNILLTKNKTAKESPKLEPESAIEGNLNNVPEIIQPSNSIEEKPSDNKIDSKKTVPKKLSSAEKNKENKVLKGVSPKNSESENKSIGKFEEIIVHKRNPKGEIKVSSETEENADPLWVSTTETVGAIKIISEKYLQNMIKYAEYVKKDEQFYKSRRVETRPDNKLLVLPLVLPSAKIIGIKIYRTSPAIYDNEYDRSMFDEKSAKEILDLKLQIENDTTNYDERLTDKFVNELDMTADDIEKMTVTEFFDRKKEILKRLKKEATLIETDHKIRICLGLDKAYPKEAVESLKQMLNIEIDELMLKKHVHVVETVKRLRFYVGNVKEWGMPQKVIAVFEKEATTIRNLADKVYERFQDILKIQADSFNDFWDKYMDIVSKFRILCEELTEVQICVLCAEPRSRQAFLDQLIEEDDHHNLDNSIET